MRAAFSAKSEFHNAEFTARLRGKHPSKTTLYRALRAICSGSECRCEKQYKIQLPGGELEAGNLAGNPRDQIWD